MEKNERIGLVLEGGGMRGIYTAGVLDVMMDNNIEFPGVIGVSAGAVHGGTFLAGQRGRNIRYYKKYAGDKRFMSLRNFIFTGEFVGRKFCYDELPNKLDPLDYDTFKKKSNDVEFYVVVSDVETGKSRYIRIFDFKEQMDALRASASLPYISKIVEYDGMKLLDGGVCDSIPANAMLNLGYDKIVVVLTRQQGYVKEPENMKYAKLFYGKYPKLREALATRHIHYNNSIKEIEELERAGKAFVIRPSVAPQVGRMEGNPKKIQEVYDIGFNDMTNRIDELKKWMGIL